MPAEDRDRLFEKALARHLRGGADDDYACPDAETLAAYHEGALSAEEMSAAKKHFAGCARCQEIQAQLEATQSVSESRNQEDQLAAGGAVARAKNAETYEEASAPKVATRNPKETESKVTHFPSKKKWLPRWVAPAGAIAAGLLLYLSFRDFRSPAKRAEPATEIAQNREDNSRARGAYVPPAVPQKEPQNASQTPPPAAPRQNDDHLAARASRQQSAQPAPGVLLDELKRLRSEAELKDSKEEKKSVPPPSVPTPMAGANANIAQSGGRISALEQGKNPAKAKTGVAADKSVVAGAVQKERDAEQSQSLQGQASGAATGAPAASPSSPVFPPPASSSQQVTVTAAAPESSNETVEVSPLNKNVANLPVLSRNVSDLALLPPRMVVALNGKSIWRFGEHGAVAHSSDGGKTWKSQEMPVTANLTSGSAPAKNICWIAGVTGTLLRTTDGGKHWQLIITPIAGDLGGVMASDGKRAAIWDVSRQATYQTSDGGKTWEKKAEN
jgi:hypothetical protein